MEIEYGESSNLEYSGYSVAKRFERTPLAATVNASGNSTSVTNVASITPEAFVEYVNVVEKFYPRIEMEPVSVSWFSNRLKPEIEQLIVLMGQAENRYLMRAPLRPHRPVEADFAMVDDVVRMAPNRTFGVRFKVDKVRRAKPRVVPDQE